MTESKEDVSMSVVATTNSSQGPLASTQIGGGGGGSTSRSRTQSIDHHHPATAPPNVTQTTRSADPESRDSISSQGLDFIGTGGAVKKLFSIPLSEESVCVAVHNIHGTLLVDEVVPEEYYDEDGESSIAPTTSDGDTAQPLPPSSQSLALALALSPSSDGEDVPDGPLPLLSKMIQKSSLEETTATSSRQGDQLSSSWIMPRITPSPVRDYVEWQFQDMNLLVGSDALIVRPDRDGVGGGDGVIVRVEEVQKLRRMAEWEQAQRLAQDEKTQDAGGSHSTTTEEKEKQLSYADVLVQSAPTRALLTNSSAQNDNEESSSSDTAPKRALNLDQVQLQTCIVPSSGPLGGWLTTSPPSSREQPDVSPTTTLEPTTSPGSSKCIVLDAYLDNLMANVPQLALCLQEKGLIQSVKLLDRDQIPTMMMHSNTLDTTKPVETMHEHNASSSSSSPDLFSPEIMEMNATALLRFLKANCSTNNTTYLLRTDGPNTNNIQLYDISSISQQRQKKWIWWLATMSYRFALRLRQLESHGVLPMHQRSFRDRQRNLLQTTLDLLQDLSDMDGNAHESMVASVREHLADTFLGETTATDAATENNNNQDSNATTPTASPPPVMASQHPPVVTTPAPPVPVGTRSQPTDPQQHQPYSAISTDALNKAHDHLISGIKALTPVLESQIRPPKSAPTPARRRKRAGASAKATTQPEPPSPAMVSQLFGLNHKLVNVTLRLAEHYLGQYSSSSAMQSLRHAARRMADSIALLEYILSADEWLSPLRLQYTWLWEHCGHFARSFASDDLWRDRGHATGDDVLYVLKDVENAFVATCLPFNFSNLPDPMKAKTKGVVSLQTLSALYSPKLGELKRDNVPESPAWEEARKYLSNQGLLQRDKRQVLVASCISYQRAIVTFEEIADENQPGFVGPSPILNLLRQRLGDACNEIGKALLASLRSFLCKPPPQSSGMADVLLDSAQFWFLEGLEAFEVSGDPRNIALLRCNLCQCCKLRANASFSSQAPVDSSVSHAEVCLEKAASHLQAAHETLGTRDVDPMTWDMVSNELAATFLVLAVRRRQSLLGGGAAPVLLEALRLSPGKERSIIEPMEKSLAIYEQAGNLHQAAAVQYQLALTNSKVWTCQRDETKTREKLSAAFSQYQNAFAYFSSHLRGNEPTFVLLCLDIASLYAAVSGEECLAKALTRCLDTVGAFSADAIAAAGSSSQWLEQMETLAGSVDDRIFKLLRSLAKVEDSQKWKDLYRVGLSAKMTQKTSNPKMNALESVHGVMIALRANFDDNK